MTKREYLVSLGLAKEGRGKFSKDGIAALDKAISEGMTFDDNKPAPVKKVSLAKPERPVNPLDLARPFVKRPEKPFRKQETLYSISPEGYTVGFDKCQSANCGEPVAWCACKDGPKAPKDCYPVGGKPLR